VIKGVENLGPKHDKVEGSIDGLGFRKSAEGSLRGVELVLIDENVLALTRWRSSAGGAGLCHDGSQ
jgi:hypothetical protein